MNSSTLAAVASSAKTQLRLAYSMLYTYAVYYWLVIKFKIVGVPSKGWTVSSIIAIREPPSTSDDPHDDDFMMIDHTRIDTTGDIVAAVRDHVPPAWADFKVEVRMRHGSKKKRFVARSHETLVWSDDILVRQPMVLSAELHSERGITDVTRRVRKYIVVPERRLRPHDYFPMDDHESFEGSRLVIRALEMDGSSTVSDLEFE